MKYLLTDGSTTSKIEVYVLDLFKLFMTVHTGDIIMNRSFGGEFSFSGVTNSTARIDVESKAEKIISQIKKSIPSTVILNLVGVQFVSPTEVSVSININDQQYELGVENTITK